MSQLWDIEKFSVMTISDLHDLTSKCNITRPNCALDRSTILCLYVPGFQRQVFKQVKMLSERSKRRKEQKKNLLRNPLTMLKMHSLALRSQSWNRSLILPTEFLCCSGWHFFSDKFRLFK